MKRFLLIGAACVGLAACSTNTPVNPTLLNVMSVSYMTADASLTALLAPCAPTRTPACKIGGNDIPHVQEAKTTLETAYATFQAGGDTNGAALQAAITAAAALGLQYLAQH